MARSPRRRERHRSDVVEGHARIVLPLDALDWPARPDPQLRHLARFLPRVASTRADELVDAPSVVTVVLDGFAFTLYVADPQDAIEYTATHHGAEFLAAATRHGHVEVFVSSGVDPRRSTPADLDASATAGSMVGARVGAFAVQTLGT